MKYLTDAEDEILLTVSFKGDILYANSSYDLTREKNPDGNKALQI